jgi:hypothetical protein
MNKSKKKRMSNPKKVLIALASFLAFIIIVSLGLFLFARFYLVNRYTLYYSEEGEFELLKRAETSGYAAFGNLQISKKMEKETFKPLGICYEFDQGFREVYASIFVSGVELDDRYTYRWLNTGTGEKIIDFSDNYFTTDGFVPNFIYIPLKENIEDYRIFSEPGKYTVEFYHNGKLVDSADFTVN